MAALQNPPDPVTFYTICLQATALQLLTFTNPTTHKRVYSSAEISYSGHGWAARSRLFCLLGACVGLREYLGNEVMYISDVTEGGKIYHIARIAAFLDLHEEACKQHWYQEYCTLRGRRRRKLR